MGYIEKPFFIQEFKKALGLIKQRCVKYPDNEICKILKKEINIDAIEANINIDGVVEVAQCLKKDSSVKTIAQKIEADPKKAKECFKNGDKKSWKKFEQHLKKEVKKQAPVKCLWNKQERAKYEAAAFVVAVECSKSHHDKE